MAHPVHFFDLFSDFPGTSKSWSPNTLKTRAVLNFKRIPYTQSWISYPDIKPLLSGLGVPPHPKGTPGAAYTLPAIILPNKKTGGDATGMMDSLLIALHLDDAYPEPPLFPSGDASYALLRAVIALVGQMSSAYTHLILPRVANHLDERGCAYFTETRTIRFGRPLAEVRPTDAAEVERQYRATEDATMPFVDMLKGRANKKGVFFEGTVPGYADLYLCCHLAFVQRFDTELFGRLMGLGNGEIKALYDACLPWLDGQGEDKEWPVEEAK